MCLAIKHSSQLLGLINKFNKDVEMLREKEQQYDKEVSRIYHSIEKTVLCEEQGYQFAIKLQEALKLRRKTKYELAQLKYFLKSIGCDDFKSKVEEIKCEILDDEKQYISRFPLYKDIINTDYHKLNKKDNE